MLEMLLCKRRKKKFSTKGMSKKQNEITWQRLKAALNGGIDRAENRGFRTFGNHMMTYEQHKLGLSAYYDKRWVLPDGIHTEPIEFHTGGSCVLGGTTKSSSRTKPRLGPSDK